MRKTSVMHELGASRGARGGVAYLVARCFLRHGAEQDERRTYMCVITEVVFGGRERRKCVD